MNFPACGDILKDVEPVKQVMEHDGVLLVEQREKFRFDRVDIEVRRIESLGKTIEGIVLLKKIAGNGSYIPYHQDLFRIQTRT